jgi:hypothetical protein
MTHEMGHCLGLWHTHHGVDETDGCSDPCYENTHTPNDPAADLVGDFCKDTPPTPTNYDCAPPGGTDCFGISWGTTDYTNFMGYGDDSCIDHFTGEQGSRLHCWSRDALSGLLILPCTEPLPGAPTDLSATSAGTNRIDLSWTDNANNEDGFVIERASGTGFEEIDTVGANVTGYADTGVSCGSSYDYRVAAYNCKGTSAYSNTASATTDPCQGLVVHVQAIDLNIKTAGKNVSARGYVTVVDGGQNPVANATVYADWTGTTSASQTALTGSDGRAFFQSPKKKATSYCWTLTVTNITGANMTYDPGANIETSDSVGNSCAKDLAGRGEETILYARQSSFSSGEISIEFLLPHTSRVALNLYDLRGRLVRNLIEGAHLSGTQFVSWDGQDRYGRVAANGVYFFRLVADQEVKTGRVVLIR